MLDDFIRNPELVLRGKRHPVLFCFAMCTVIISPFAALMIADRRAATSALHRPLSWAFTCRRSVTLRYRMCRTSISGASSCAMSVMTWR
jgi:hypothetical protein